MSQPIEFDSIKDHCLHHRLRRPNIRWGKLSINVLSFEALVLMAFCWMQLGKGSFFIFFELVHLLTFLLLGRQILRLAVKVYQRYTPDYVRRRCQCMPTCSEYALLALEKYYWPKALVLIFKRVTRTCGKAGYIIDYP